MAFSVPDFNLVCNVFTGPWPTRVLRIPDLQCNLAFGRRTQQSSNFDPFAGVSFVQPTLLVPALSDVRYLMNAPVADLVECPSGSGRWYLVIGIEDIGKGFSNEHRAVILQQVWQDIDGAGTFPGLFWPIPIP